MQTLGSLKIYGVEFSSFNELQSFIKSKNGKSSRKDERNYVTFPNSVTLEWIRKEEQFYLGKVYDEVGMPETVQLDIIPMVKTVLESPIDFPAS